MYSTPLQIIQLGASCRSITSWWFQIFRIQKHRGQWDKIGKLSQNGKKLVRDLCVILEAFKAYSSHKNGTVFLMFCFALVSTPFVGKNLVQEAIWHLRQADIAASALKSLTFATTHVCVNGLKIILHIQGMHLKMPVTTIWRRFGTLAKSSVSARMSLPTWVLTPAANRQRTLMPHGRKFVNSRNR